MPVAKSRVMTLEVFLKKVNKSAPNGCWEWTGFVAHGWYGQCGFRKKKHATHRVSWMLHVGEIPNGLCVCHKCDNPLCVNPSHLFLGTHLDNMRDCSAKGRHRPKARKTHCPIGHPYEGDNIIWSTGPGKPRRSCRECGRTKAREYARRISALKPKCDKFNKLYEYNGKSQTLKAWSKELSVKYPTLWARIQKGWPPELVFGSPVIPRGRRHIPLAL